MRTSVVSDIHIDINEDYPVVEELLNYQREHEVTHLLIAGDISSDPEMTRKTVQEIREKGKQQVYYVPGNHDLWKKAYPNASTVDIYGAFQKDENCLCDKRVVIGEHVILGDVAWFDYSYANPTYTQTEFDSMSKNGRTWQDYYFNDWSKENKKTCDFFLEKLEKQIKEVKQEMPEKKILLMTHMISHEMFCVPEHIADWSYFNAFLGSRKLQELAVKYQVDYAVCGHVHYRATKKQDGVTWMCRCLNYHTEWQGNKDIKKQLADAIEVIDL